MRPRILNVDDEQEMTELLAFSLGAAGYQVDQAHDGFQALEMARTNQPDLILLDVMLPELDGFSVCEILRRTPSTSKIPVIMLTGWASESAKVVGYEAGANDYMVKPFSTRELVLRVRNLLTAPSLRTPGQPPLPGSSPRPSDNETKNPSH